MTSPTLCGPRQGTTGPPFPSPPSQDVRPRPPPQPHRCNNTLRSSTQHNPTSMANMAHSMTRHNAARAAVRTTSRRSTAPARRAPPAPRATTTEQQTSATVLPSTHTESSSANLEQLKGTSTNRTCLLPLYFAYFFVSSPGNTISTHQNHKTHTQTNIYIYIYNRLRTGNQVVHNQHRTDGVKCTRRNP